MNVKTAIAAAALAMATAAVATAGQRTVSKVDDLVKASATIQAIDMTSRMITFKNEDGTEDTVWAPPEIARFNELKAGDVVNLTYYRSTVYQLRQPGSPAPKPTDAVGTTGGGQALPGGTMARQVTDTVTVKSVDADAGTITVTTSKGHTVSRKVDKKENLQGIKAGDMIDITYTEALLASVERK